MCIILGDIDSTIHSENSCGSFIFVLLMYNNQLINVAKQKQCSRNNRLTRRNAFTRTVRFHVTVIIKLFNTSSPWTYYT